MGYWNTKENRRLQDNELTKEEKKTSVTKNNRTVSKETSIVSYMDKDNNEKIVYEKNIKRNVRLINNGFHDRMLTSVGDTYSFFCGQEKTERYAEYKTAHAKILIKEEYYLPEDEDIIMWISCYAIDEDEEEKEENRLFRIFISRENTDYIISVYNEVRSTLSDGMVDNIKDDIFDKSIQGDTLKEILEAEFNISHIYEPLKLYEAMESHFLKNRKKDKILGSIMKM